MLDHLLRGNELFVKMYNFQILNKTQYDMEFSTVLFEYTEYAFWLVKMHIDMHLKQAKNLTGELNLLILRLLNKKLNR